MYCGKCGAARAEGDSFCPRCGAAYAAEEPGAGAGFSSPVAPADPASDDTPFSGEMTLAAFLLAIFMPFIALIAALVMRSSEQQHWTAIVPCTGGGTTTRPAKPGEVPGGSP
jgi:hypothetical protein